MQKRGYEQIIINYHADIPFFCAVFTTPCTKEESGTVSNSRSSIRIFHKQVTPVAVRRLVGDIISAYITKYITEDLQRSVQELNAHVYYCSQGLRRAIVVDEGHLSHELRLPDYENDYVHVRNFGSYEEAEAAVS